MLAALRQDPAMVKELQKYDFEDIPPALPADFLVSSLLSLNMRRASFAVSLRMLSSPKTVGTTPPDQPSNVQLQCPAQQSAKGGGEEVKASKSFALLTSKTFALLTSPDIPL